MSMMLPEMGAPPAGPPEAPPASIQVPVGEGPEAAGADDPVESLRALIEGTLEYMSLERDEEDKAKGAQALKIFQDLLAINQRQADQAQGTPEQFKFARKKGMIGGGPAQ